MKNTDEPPPRELHILLADDDKDDCLLFKEALKELQLQTALTIVHNGAQHYICKPADFYELRKIIQEALLVVSEKKFTVT